MKSLRESILSKNPELPDLLEWPSYLRWVFPSIRKEYEDVSKHSGFASYRKLAGQYRILITWLNALEDTMLGRFLAGDSMVILGRDIKKYPNGARCRFIVTLDLTDDKYIQNIQKDLSKVSEVPGLKSTETEVRKSESYGRQDIHIFKIYLNLE